MPKRKIPIFGQNCWMSVPFFRKIKERHPWFPLLSPYSKSMYLGGFSCRNAQFRFLARIAGSPCLFSKRSKKHTPDFYVCVPILNVCIWKCFCLARVAEGFLFFPQKSMKDTPGFYCWAPILKVCILDFFRPKHKISIFGQNCWIALSLFPKIQRKTPQISIVESLS